MDLTISTTKKNEEEKKSRPPFHPLARVCRPTARPPPTPPLSIYCFLWFLALPPRPHRALAFLQSRRRRIPPPVTRQQRPSHPRLPTRRLSSLMSRRIPLANRTATATHPCTSPWSAPRHRRLASSSRRRDLTFAPRRRGHPAGHPRDKAPRPASLRLLGGGGEE
jgi:hypothetical protein